MGASNIRGITIQIDGNTTGLQKALSEVDKSIKSTQTALKDVNKLLKLDPKNTELLTQKQKLLKQAIDDTKGRLTQLKDAQKQVGEGTAEWDALEREIIETEQKLKSLEKEYRDFGSVGTQQVKAVGEQMQNLGDKITGAGQKLAPVSAAASAALIGAVKETAEFDAQMSKVQAISGASYETMDALRDKAREMGAATKFSAKEAGEGFEYMAMAGWKDEQMLAGIAPILNLAAASGEELGTTSDIVTDALTAFGLTAEDTERFVNVIAAASSNANTNVSMLGESFKYVAPVAGAMSYSIDDMALALGLMANAGIKGSQAGASLRNVIQRMAKPTKESGEAMQRLGLTLADEEGNLYSFREIMDQLRVSMSDINMPTEEYIEQCEELDRLLEAGEITQKTYNTRLDELTQETYGAEGAEKARAAAMLGGARAMAGLLAISNATEEDYQKLVGAIEGSSDVWVKTAEGAIIPYNEALASGAEITETYNGEAEKMAAVMQDNLNGQLTILKSGISELAISIGESLMPYIEKAVEKVQDLVDWFNGLDESKKQLIATILVLVAVLAPVLIIFGTLVSSIGAIITVIAPLLAGIGALFTAFSGIIPIVAAVIAIIVLLVTHWDWVKEKCGELAKYLGEKWEEIKETVSQKIEDLKTAAVEKWEAIKTDVTEKVETLKGDMIEKWEAIKTTVTDAIDNAHEAVTTKAEEIYNSIKDNVDNAIDYLKDLPSKALTWGSDLIKSFTDGIKDGWDMLSGGVEWVANGITDFLGFSEPDKGPLSNFHTFAPDMMRLYAEGIRDNMYLVTDQMQALSANMAATMQRPASIYLTSNTVLNGRVIASAINEELGFLL